MKGTFIRLPICQYHIAPDGPVTQGANVSAAVALIYFPGVSRLFCFVLMIFWFSMCTQVRSFLYMQIRPRLQNTNMYTRRVSDPAHFPPSCLKSLVDSLTSIHRWATRATSSAIMHKYRVLSDHWLNLRSQSRLDSTWMWVIPQRGSHPVCSLLSSWELSIYGTRARVYIAYQKMYHVEIFKMLVI